MRLKDYGFWTKLYFNNYSNIIENMLKGNLSQRLYHNGQEVHCGIIICNGQYFSHWGILTHQALADLAEENSATTRKVIANELTYSLRKSMNSYVGA